MYNFFTGNNNLNNQKLECWYCGQRSSRAESMANGVSASLASMYCSKECETKDTEEVNAEIILAAAIEDAAPPEAKEIPLVTQVTVGGFKMRVKS